jgi:hypothetical protein
LLNDREADVVRTEVRGLLRARKTVIVLLADRAPLTRADLPPDLAALEEIQGLEISHETWQSSFPRVLSDVRGTPARHPLSRLRSEVTFSVSDALRCFSIRLMVAASADEANRALLHGILSGRTSTFVKTVLTAVPPRDIMPGFAEVRP